MPWRTRCCKRLDRLVSGKHTKAKGFLSKVLSMARFILRFRGSGPKVAQDVERIRALHNATVLDDSSPRMLLVEAPEADLKALIDSMPGWIMAEERMIPLPDPRPKPRRRNKKGI